MTFSRITHRSSDYEQECALRDEVLRIPLGLSISDDDLSAEGAEIHFGLFDKTSLVACVIAAPTSPRSAKIRQMAVSPEYQGKGYGRELLTKVEEHLSNSGFLQLSLHARMSVVQFYERLAFTKNGPTFLEVGIPHVTMIKDLGDRTTRS